MAPTRPTGPDDRPRRAQTETLAAIAAAPDEARWKPRASPRSARRARSLPCSRPGQNVAGRAQQRGAAINALKDEVTEALAARRDVLKAAALEARLKTEALDVTLPVRPAGVDAGRIHPISQVFDEVTAIFADMGFAIAEGPDIESDDYNFTKLNFRPGHPAREMHDTFFFAPDANGERKLLRTHTSPVQVRTMLAQKPPIRIVCPGRTYRTDLDQTHTPMFHQVEGLVIDKSANLGNLKWVLEEFCKAFFEVPDVGMRFRPSYFPFTSPSIEVDIQCRRSGGEIRFGEGEDWLEILGCGMVHANVLRIAASIPTSTKASPGAWGSTHRDAEIRPAGPARPVRRRFALDRSLGFRPLDIPTLAGGLSG